MNLSRERLEAEAAATGFAPGPLEKVAYLLALLEGFNRHPYLKGKLALKGGTALNLFVFDVPRLSVDIDLNYIGALDLETTRAERPKIEEAIEAVCRQEGLIVQKIPTQHAGGSWVLRYRGVRGNTDTIKVDVIYMYRSPLWTPQSANSRAVGTFQAEEVLVLNPYELASGKLAAFMSRRTARDLFDSHALLTGLGLDQEQLRLGFVVYGGMNRMDWRKIGIDNIDAAAADMENQLLPLLRRATLPDPFDATAWTGQLVQECKAAMNLLLPLSKNELEFLERINEHGEIDPELLTTDEALQERIRTHPSLAWKAQNVKKFKAEQAPRISHPKGSKR